jgi:predicted nucleotidyltransferase component of viral defense system
VLSLQRNKGKIEEVSLKDLKRIYEEAKKFGLNLILIGGYAVRAFTNERSWRVTKDIDFIATRKDLPALRGVFNLLKYSFEKTEYGVKSSKKVNKESIELHISVDKVIDWSTGLEYLLPKDIFKRAVEAHIKPYFEENKEIEVSVKVASMEDVLIMKLMTDRTRDQFDAVTIIMNSFEKLNMKRFWENSEQSHLDQHIRKRLNSLLVDVKKGIIKRLWEEFTGRNFVREQEVTLKDRINKLLKKCS